MQFPNIEDEEGDFNVSNVTRSRLSSLFHSERSSGDVNQALTFTAPKQPKKNDSSQASQEKLKLISASSVNAYKLIDGNYVPQGKLGCAILGFHENRNYKLLLYKGKQVQVSTSNITSTFKFYVQPNNYATFYDEVSDNWSINFDSEDALLNFAKQISITKANAESKNQSIVIQDLAIGEGPSLEIGDSAEVKYTGWLLSNYTFGQVFDGNMLSDSSFRLRLGKKVITGWSEGLVGAQKGTKRLLVIPPNLAYGAKGKGSAVPPNSTLIFEVLVVKVKVSREASHSPSPLKTAEAVPEKKPEVQPRHSITSEDNIRLRGASISEQLSQSPKKDKAQLISRMAKMGTATLPFHGAVVAQTSSESENEEEAKEEIQPGKSTPPIQLSGSRTSSPKLASKSSSRKNSEHLTTVQPIQLQSVQESNYFQVSHQPNMSYPQAAMPNQQPYNTPTNAFSPFQTPLPTQYSMPQMPYSPHNMSGIVPHVTSMVDTHLPMLITESRTQNTEVRLSLSKITEKVDTVMQKIDDIRVNQGRTAVLGHSSFMDSALLVQSIEKIVQENNQLKGDVEVKNVKIQSLNEKICDLLQRNQGFFEESNNMLEQKSDSLHAVSAESQAKLFNLEKEKAKLSSELSNALHKLSTAEAEAENYQNQESRLKQKLQEGERQIKELELKLNTLKGKVDLESETSSLVTSLQTEIKDLLDEKTTLKTHLDNWDDKYSSLNKALDQKERELVELKEQFEKKNSDLKSSSNTVNEKTEAMRKEIESIQAEKAEFISNCEELKTKLSESNKSELLLKKQMNSLKTEFEKASMWKEKYEVFYQKTRQMKENYEAERQRLLTELEQAQSNSSSPDFSGEIRKTMNVLYKLLQGKFEPNASYSGSEVLTITLQTIRVLTMRMLQQKGQRSDTLIKESDKSEQTPSTNASEVAPSEATSLDCDDHVSNEDKAVEENGVKVGISPVPEIQSSMSEVVQEVHPQENVQEENGVKVEVSPEPCTQPLASEEAHPQENVLSSSEQVGHALSNDNKASSDSPEQLLECHIDSQKTSLDFSERNNLEVANDLREEPSENVVETSSNDVAVKSPNGTAEKNKAEDQNRDSPDLAQQLAATNNSDRSLFETDASKVFDGSSTMHA